MPTTIQTAASATTKPKSDRSRNRNRPGYIQPKQIGAKMIGSYTPPAKHAAFKRAAEAEHKTMKQMISDFIDAKAAPYMPAEVQKHPERKPSRVREKRGEHHPSL